MSITPMGGPRARHLIRVTFGGTTAVSTSWAKWVYNPTTATYGWVTQANAAFEFEGFALGSLIVPSGWTTADIGLKICDTATGTFVPYKVDGTNDYVESPMTTVIEQADASEAYAMPPNWFGAGPFVKLHSMTASQAGDQTQTDKSIILWLLA